MRNRLRQIANYGLDDASDEELVRIISQFSSSSYAYARDFIRARWEPGEESILRDVQRSYLYARDVLKGRWERAESLIMQDGAISLKYARDVVEGRWEPGEEAISESTELMYEYAKEVCKGRLPDAMHNKMVMLSFSDQSDEWVKKYCGAKKYMIKRRKAS